jgi:glucose/arabinose transport system permease protein
MKSMHDTFFTDVLVPSRNIDISPLLDSIKYMVEPILSSFLIIVPSALVSALLGALSAYAVYRAGGRHISLFLAIFGLSLGLPMQTTLIPLVYIENVILHVYGTYLGIFLAFTIYMLPGSVFISLIFLSSIPKQFIEAGLVDGANEIRIFSSILMPLFLPGFISLFIYLIIMGWNNFYLPFILTRGIGAFGATAVLALYGSIGQYGTLYNEVYAKALLASLVPLVIFIILGRYFIRGLLTFGAGGR